MKPSTDSYFDSQPSLTDSRQQGTLTLTLGGQWTLRTLPAAADVRRRLGKFGGSTARWDLRAVQTLDSAAAFLLWQAWGQQLPAQLLLRPEHEALFANWHRRHIPKPVAMAGGIRPLAAAVLQSLRAATAQFLAWLMLFGRWVLDMLYFLRHPDRAPYAGIVATLYQTGVTALGITALVGFLVGISLSYLSALQLQRFGADIYIIDLLGLGIVRELGPVLTAILVAGRSGSAMAAEIGIMRVTQELDALSALGISLTQRLVFPKVLALALALPLLMIWTDALALLGGMLAANLTLDIGPLQFLQQLPQAVPVSNVYIGLAKGVTFGVMIALIACHFGFAIQPNSESLGRETTRAVVAVITTVIALDSLFSILFRNVGFP